MNGGTCGVHCTDPSVERVALTGNQVSRIVGQLVWKSSTRSSLRLAQGDQVIARRLGQARLQENVALTPQWGLSSLSQAVMKHR